MSKADNEFILVAKLLREAADAADDVIKCETKEALGEDLSKEKKSALGTFMYKMMELSALSKQ